VSNFQSSLTGFPKKDCKIRVNKTGLAVPRGLEPLTFGLGIRSSLRPQRNVSPPRHQAFGACPLITVATAAGMPRKCLIQLVARPKGFEPSTPNLGKLGPPSRARLGRVLERQVTSRAGVPPRNSLVTSCWPPVSRAQAVVRDRNIWTEILRRGARSDVSRSAPRGSRLETLRGQSTCAADNRRAATVSGRDRFHLMPE